MTTDQLKARRRVIVKRQGIRKLKATWAEKRARGDASRRIDPLSDEHDHAGVPETDAALDELPASLVG